MAYNPYAGMAGMMGGAGLGSLFGGNPADAGMPYLNQLRGQMSDIYGPYMQHGEDMYGPLSGQLNSLMSDPGGRVNQIGSSYHQSPGFQFQLQQALQAGNQSAAAGGMAGTPQHQQQNMTVANGLANQDYNQYLQNALGEYNQGLGGAQNIYGIGANAASQYGGNLSSLAGAQAQMAAAGQQSKNEGMGGLLGAFGSLAGFLL